MGGLNQNNTHYSAPAMQQASHHSGANMSHYSRNSANTKKDGVSFAALPEYQYPSSKNTSGSSGFPNHPRGVPAAKMALPRQHIMPPTGNSGKHHYPVQQPLIESPTLSQGSENQEGTSASSNNSQQQQFHYNPYDTNSSRVTYQHQQQQYGQFPNTTCDNASRTTSLGYDSTTQSGGYGFEEEQMEEAPAKSILPYGTLHGNLEGYVSFVPYPTEEFVNPHKTMQVPSEGNMSRVFLGQLPYQVTDMQLDWLCFTFGNGGAVHFPERITKHDPLRGCKVPTGCIHAYADNEAVTSMLSHMHKRILVDDTGVWYAETPEQQSILNDYCLMMKNDRTKRYQNRPYDTVVAQFATSNFVQRRR